jgi:hypothetical protein
VGYGAERGTPHRPQVLVKTYKREGQPLHWWQIALEVTRTVAAVAVPIVVAVVGYRLNRRLKIWEASQWRNQELIKARLDYYQSIAPKLNDLMCYFTFIGSWKELTPPGVVALKRELDREFFTALPLFSQGSETAYIAFMDTCFLTFGAWGEDAKLRTGYGRRRDAFPQWDPAWDQVFTHAQDEGVSPDELKAFRERYDAVLRALAKDIELLEPRDRYATADISINAH